MLTKYAVLYVYFGRAFKKPKLGFIEKCIWYSIVLAFWTTIIFGLDDAAIVWAVPVPLLLLWAIIPR